MKNKSGDFHLLELETCCFKVVFYMNQKNESSSWRHQSTNPWGSPKIENPDSFSLAIISSKKNLIIQHSWTKIEGVIATRSFTEYQIVRKLSIRFLRNYGFLPNTERFLESFFAKNVQTGVVEATFAILGLSIWWFGSKSADQKIILDFLLEKFYPLSKNILYKVLLVQNTLE